MMRVSRSRAGLVVDGCLACFLLGLLSTASAYVLACGLGWRFCGMGVGSYSTLERAGRPAATMLNTGEVPGFFAWVDVI